MDNLITTQPVGTIRVNDASVKYGVHVATIRWWMRDGRVKFVKGTNKHVYLDEQSVIDYITKGVNNE